MGCCPARWLCRGRFRPPGPWLSSSSPGIVPWPESSWARAAPPRGAWFPFLAPPWGCPHAGESRCERRAPAAAERAPCFFPRRRHPVAEMLDLPFLPFCAFLGGLGFVCVAFVSAWCQHWRGGFALDGGVRTFNWHPVLMVTGMVVLYGAGERHGAARTPPGTAPPPDLLSPNSGLGVSPAARLERPQAPLEGAARRPEPGSLRPRRAGLGGRLSLPQPARDAQHVLAAQLAGAGHRAALLLPGGCCPPVPPRRVPALRAPSPSRLPSRQWLAGFGTFLLPWAPAWLRALYKPVHVFFGSAILMLSVASCVSGINEKLFFSL